MAASLVQCRILFASTNCCKKHRLTLVPKRHASKFIVDYRTVDDEEEPFEDLRDVSRLSERLKTKLPKNAEAPEPDFIPPTYAKDQKHTRTFQRRMFAKFGEKYAINPANLWPTQEEIAKEKLRDSFFDIPLEESFEKIRIAKEEKEENRRKSEELIEKNMQKMDEWIKAFENRKIVAAQKEEKSAAKKKLVEDQLYDHFGYQISANTTKAKEYLKEVAEKEKKAKKIQFQLMKQEKEKAQLKELLQREAEEEIK